MICQQASRASFHRQEARKSGSSHHNHKPFSPQFLRKNQEHGDLFSGYITLKRQYCCHPVRADLTGGKELCYYIVWTINGPDHSTNLDNAF